jgi:predicted site-specific integrase-resolvase
VNLKEWAASTGITYIMVGQTVVYARVSSADQKADGDRQVARVTVWATGRKPGVDRVVTAILTSLCARLYGRRVAAGRARRAVEAATEDPA